MDSEMLEMLRSVMREELAPIHQQLDAVNQHLDKHEQQLHAINQRLDKHEQQLHAINQRLDKHEQQLDAINQRLDKHEQLLEKHGAVLQELKSGQRRNSDMIQQLIHIVGNTNAKLDDLSRHIQLRFQTVEEAVQQNAKKLDDLIEHHRSIHELLGEHDTSIRTLKRKLS